MLVPKLCGVKAAFLDNLPPELGEETLVIIVGTPSGNRYVRKAADRGLFDTKHLLKDDFIIRRADFDEHRVLIITGQTERAVMYGVFEFFEKLGCLFLISRDVLPETNSHLAIPSLDVTGHTDNRRRGLFSLFGGHAHGLLGYGKHGRCWRRSRVLFLLSGNFV